MAYSVNSLTTAADCDLMLGVAEKEKNDLSFRKISLERRQKQYAENSIDLEADLQATTAELSALGTIIAALPEGQVKDDNITRQKRLELKLFLLNDKKENYGGIALVDKEFDLARVIKELEETETFIAAVQARKAAL